MCSLDLNANLVYLSGRWRGKELAKLGGLLLVGAATLKSACIFLCLPEAEDVALACLVVRQHVAACETSHLPELRHHRVLVDLGCLLRLARFYPDRDHSRMHRLLLL